MKKYLLFIIITISIVSCKNTVDTKNIDKVPAPIIKSNKIELIEIDRPVRNQMHTIGDPIQIILNQINTDRLIDSVKIFFDNSVIQNYNSFNQNSSINPIVNKVGYHELKIVAYSEKESDSKRVKLRFKSNIEPENLSCKIINTYKHDSKAYTQGLQFADGILYEGTGQYGQSSLRKVELKSGEVKQYMNIKQQYFGEGITIMNDKIIQVTWNSRTGIIYEKESFKQLATFTYNTEGWGITYNGEQLIMSVGTNKLHFIDTDVFSEIETMEVYNNKGPITYLNELEFVDGFIYANVWQKDYIIVIDPANGKVLKKIDCSNLVPEKYKNHNDFVLNGIAYNKKNGHFYLTGKYWDVLYEVVFE